eukprot:jgi/Chlat1/5668/Chrsp37S09013
MDRDVWQGLAWDSANQARILYTLTVCTQLCWLVLVDSICVDQNSSGRGRPFSQRVYLTLDKCIQVYVHEGPNQNKPDYFIKENLG